MVKISRSLLTHPNLFARVMISKWFSMDFRIRCDVLSMFQNAFQMFCNDFERMLLKRGMGNGEWDDSGEWEIEMGI